MEATTQLPCFLASSTSAMCPACRLPIVGTRTTDGSPFSRARSSSTV